MAFNVDKIFLGIGRFKICHLDFLIGTLTIKEQLIYSVNYFVYEVYQLPVTDRRRYLWDDPEMWDGEREATTSAEKPIYRCLTCFSIVHS